MGINFLKEFSKKEILEWHSQQLQNRYSPTKSKMLLVRWELKSKEFEKKERLHLEKFKNVDFKSRDELARKYNDEGDVNKKLEILKKMAPYEKQWKDILEESKKQNKERIIIEKIYQEYSRNRQKEKEEEQIKRYSSLGRESED